LLTNLLALCQPVQDSNPQPWDVEASPLSLQYCRWL
jgi:hypothetical protein